jgi:hypothetical protein
MKTLYISDLDGTLLNKQASLSEKTIETLNNLIDNGLHFSIATARSAATVTKIMAPISMNIPAVLMNGVLIYDFKTQKYLSIQYLSKEIVATIIDTLNEFELSGFMYKVKDHILTTYYTHLSNVPQQDFYNERVTLYHKNFIQLANLLDHAPEDIIYFCLLDSKERLEPVYNKLKTNPNIAMAYYKDIYYTDDTWYLEIFSAKATKYNATMYLRATYDYDYIIGFGDNLNDLPLFSACNETCAVENAKEELKAIATHIIDSNQKDGVVNWIKKNLK